MKNNKTKSVKNAVVAPPKTRTSVDYTARFNSAKGRFLGVMTIDSRNKVTKYNARFVSQGEQFVTLFDRNKNKNVRVAKNTIIGLSGV